VTAKLKQLELPLNLPLSKVQKKDLFSCKNSCIYHSIDLHNIFSKSSSNIFTFIDLFAGIGGFRIAFENLGGKCVFSSEIDKYSRQTYSGMQSYEVQARGLSPLLIKILAYLTFMNTAISSKL
jgi:hypothetical protein